MTVSFHPFHMVWRRAFKLLCGADPQSLRESMDGKFQKPVTFSVRGATLDTETLSVGKERHKENSIDTLESLQITSCPTSKPLILVGARMVSESSVEALHSATPAASASSRWRYSCSCCNLSSSYSLHEHLNKKEITRKKHCRFHPCTTAWGITSQRNTVWYCTSPHHKSQPSWTKPQFSIIPPSPYAANSNPTTAKTPNQKTPSQKIYSRSTQPFQA